MLTMTVLHQTPREFTTKGGTKRKQKTITEIVAVYSPSRDNQPAKASLQSNMRKVAYVIQNLLKTHEVNVSANSSP